MSVEAVWWSEQTYADALREAGFTHLTWHTMHVSPEGVRAHGRPYWQRYLTRPHAIVLVAT
ncbi:hypothetical protein GCM10010331_79980 [Streptomyces xanthochromogenes]|nr:hypothetical protein GCM10010331_79980 [Streptomyces xanthochromogenes]